MKIIEPYVEVWRLPDNIELLERAGRVCYKSEDKIKDGSADRFVKGIVARGHESVIEHEFATVKFVVDRGISHEIVRHRIGAYSQESTRYCGYNGDRFGSEITVIRPFWWKEKGHYNWLNACGIAEEEYMALLDCGWSPQQARSVLPNSLKTELVTTYNLREWRHFFRLRCDKAAHPQMQQVAIPLLLYMKRRLGVIYEDIGYNHDFSPEHYAEVAERMEG